MLTLVQMFVRIAAESDSSAGQPAGDRRRARRAQRRRERGGRRPDAGKRWPMSRPRIAPPSPPSAGDLVGVARKNLLGLKPGETLYPDRSLQARKELTAMGLALPRLQAVPRRGEAQRRARRGAVHRRPGRRPCRRRDSGAATRWISRARNRQRAARSAASSEVAPQRVERRQRGDRRGLGAQHPRPERGRHEARLATARPLPPRVNPASGPAARTKSVLPCTEPSTAAARSAGRAGSSRSGWRRPVVAQRKPAAALPGSRLRPHCSQAAITIFCQCAAPVFGAIALRPRHRARGEHRLHFAPRRARPPCAPCCPCARRADTPCTSVTRSGDSRSTGAVLQQVDRDPQPLHRGDARGELAAAAVEQRHLVALAQPQHVHRVVRRVLG